MNAKNSPDYVFSTDFSQVNNPRFQGWCSHMVCIEGECSFRFNGRSFRMQVNDIAILVLPDKIDQLEASDDLKVEYFAAPMKFLNSLLPSNNFGIGGSISLFNDPIIHTSERDAQRFLTDINLIKERMDETYHPFRRELLGSLCLMMMYDLFSFHSRRDDMQTATDRCAYVVKELLRLLRAGKCATERSVAYYAAQMNVTPQYLSKTVKRTTGSSATSFVDRYTVPIIKHYLDDEKLSLTQIADKMNFTSLSYFCRYSKKLLGMTPGEYRMSIQPRKNKR